MEYKQYKTSDFIKDEFFVRWVTRGDKGSDHFWKKWLKNHPEKSAEVAEAQRIIRSFRYKTNHVIKEESYTELLEGILRERIKKDHATEINSRSRKKFQWVAIAASVAILLVTFYYQMPVIEETEQPDRSLVVKETAKGQKSTIKLSDGTNVELNYDSKIYFTEGFSDSTRIVYLEGEAFFDVSRDEQRPFTVRSNDISTTALGTSFNINSNRVTRQVKVALLTGKVRVEDSAGRAVILEPNELAHYTDGRISKEKFEYNNEVAWKDGKLYFDQNRLEDVFEKLENWYGVEFDAQTEMQGIYTGEFSNNPPLSQVLNGIAFATGLSFEKKQHTIIIKNKDHEKSR